jgi:hypothetical protein
LTVSNSAGYDVYYKGYQMDDLSDVTSTSGNQIINLINPVSSPIKNGISENIDISWGGSYSYAYIKVGCGRQNVYQKSTAYFIINDGETKTAVFTYNTKSVPDTTSDITVGSTTY